MRFVDADQRREQPERQHRAGNGVAEPGDHEAGARDAAAHHAHRDRRGEPDADAMAVAIAASVTVVMVWRISEVSKPTSRPRAITSCTR